MDTLPNFSNSKIEIRNRIEGAIREKKRKPSIYQYSLFLCLFIFTTCCTALYLKNILIFNNSGLQGDIDYNSLEKYLRNDQLDSETIIEVPQSLSIMSAGDSTLISNFEFTKGEL
ncbi:MAG: hypothetical protein OCD02_13600 [Spirochaetaceae bacterium]